MRIITVGRQMKVTDDMKLLFEKKLKKFDKFFREDTIANVTVQEKHNQKYVEVTISSNGIVFRAEKAGETHNNALDECVEAIERQIRKNKTRLEKRLRDGAFQWEGEGVATVDEEPEYKVREKRFQVNIMTVEEAILEMNLIGHNFFVFRNADDKEINVVYIKNDGNYGIIIPE